MSDGGYPKDAVVTRLTPVDRESSLGLDTHLYASSSCATQRTVMQ